MTAVGALREQLDHELRQLTLLEGQLAELTVKRNRIRDDLLGGYAQYRDSVGGSRAEYADWRRRATRVQAATDKKLARLTEKRSAARRSINRLNMLILAHESGYRGEDTLGLLKATYLLLQKVLEQSEAVLLPDDWALISTVQLHCGYAIPDGKEEP